jgi:hypothetical protein
MLRIPTQANSFVLSLEPRPSLEGRGSFGCECPEQAIQFSVFVLFRYRQVRQWRETKIASQQGLGCYK